MGVGLIKSDLSSKMLERSQKLKKMKTPFGIPLYDITEEGRKENTDLCHKSPFVEVKYKGKTIYVQKTTIVWLLTEGEHLSTDRLFRVRSKQPFSSDTETSSSVVALSQPYVSETISGADLCAFKKEEIFRIGKVLNFAIYKEKTKKNREYKSKMAIVKHQKRTLESCAHGLRKQTPSLSNY